MMRLLMAIGTALALAGCATLDDDTRVIGDDAEVESAELDQFTAERTMAIYPYMGVSRKRVTTATGVYQD